MFFLRLTGGTGPVVLRGDHGSFLALDRLPLTMADPRTVRSLLAAMAADPALVATLRNERNTLAARIALDPAYGRTVVNGSGNGMSFTAQTTMDARQRLGFLQQALDHYDAGTTPSQFAPVSFL